MNLKDIRKVFTRFFFGIASEEDKRKVLDSEESDEMLKHQWEHYEDLRQTRPAPDHRKIYNRLQSFIKSEQNQATHPAIGPTLFKWYSVAATIVLLAGIGILIFSDAITFGEQPVSQIVQRTGKAQQLHLELADGTEVWLNGESRLTYPENFTASGLREVSLSGEAFFEVEASNEKPFLVKTRHLKVRATGTAFNVMEYEDESIARTVLMEGKVSVSNTGSKNRKNFQTSLTQNEMVTYHPDKNTFSKKYVNARQHSSWREGKLIFDNAPLEEVILRLEHWYGMDFYVEKSLKKDNRYTMTLEGDPIEEVLRILKMTTKMKYEIKGDDIYLNRK